MTTDTESITFEQAGKRWLFKVVDDPAWGNRSEPATPDDLRAAGWVPDSELEALRRKEQRVRTWAEAPSQWSGAGGPADEVLTILNSPFYSSEVAS